MKSIKNIILAALLVAGLAVSAPAESVTITNRGQVITVNIQPTAGGEVADKTIMQDYSNYVGGPGVMGTIERWYDVAVHGGAAGAVVPLRADKVIPEGAIIVGGYWQVAEAFAPGTNLLSLGFATATDLLAATTNASSAANTVRAVVPTGAANAVVLATNNVPKVFIDADNAPYTAGKLRLVLQYYLGQ